MNISKVFIDEVITWRQQFHRFPEIGFQEIQTSKRIADLLRSFGLDVLEGIAGTGVVATLENGSGPVIGPVSYTHLTLPTKA